MTLKKQLQNQLLIAPGVADGLSAKLVSLANFPCVYASGGAIARSRATPDLGLLSLTEVVSRMQEIVQATDLPVIADADTGFGNELNVVRTVKEFERAGVAAIHLEDQQFPKRCGHLQGKQLISTKAMNLKLKAAIKARESEDFLIIARTDAIAVEGFESALERAKAYLTTGVDIIFIEAPESLEQIEIIAKTIPQPKLINMFYGGKTPLVVTEDLAAMGYNIVIIPSDLQRAAIKAMQQTLTVIQRAGSSASIADQLATFDEREAIVETEKYLTFVKQ